MPVPQRVEIPLFPAGKRIALTTSWDDGTVHDRPVVAAFNEWGIKGTFNLNSGRFGQRHSERAVYIEAAEVARLYAGHEVAIHTRTHPFLERLDRSQIVAEVEGDRKALEDLVGYPVRGMAYPYGTYNARVIEVLRALGIVYSRTTESRDNPWIPAEPLAWAATCHQFDNVVERFETFYHGWDDRATGLFFVWGHAYEFETDDPARSWPNLARMFKPLSGRPDVWYATNIELFDYEAARQRIVIASNRASAYNPSALGVWLSVDGRGVEVPGGATLDLTTA